MVAKHQIKKNLFKILCIIIIIIFIFGLLSTHQMRMRISLLYFIITIFLFANKKRIIAILCSCLCVINLLFYIYSFYATLDKTKFIIVRSIYEKQANTIFEEEISIVDKEIKYETKKNKKEFIFLTQNGDYYIFKKGNFISVYFPTRINFFNSTGYIYCKDLSKTMKTEKNNIYSGISDYDSIDILNECWSYVKLY